MEYRLYDAFGFTYATFGRARPEGSMTIEKLDGTSPRLYALVAPLVMRRSVLRHNYYVSGDDPQLLARFLREIVRYYGRDYAIRSVTLIRHAEVFRAEGFAPVREWKEYVAMEYGKSRRP